MAVVSDTPTNRQFGFHSVRVAYARLWRSASVAAKEIWKVILVLTVCLATMVVFVALGVWMWIPPLHQ